MQNLSETIYAEFANSKSICTILDSFNQSIDQQELINYFYDNVFNLKTATGWGLDVWGRIVGVSRVLQISSSTYIGFHEADDGSSAIETFNNGIFYSGQVSTQNYSLTDDVYRRLIFAKAAANISSGSISNINAMLMNLFAGSGNIWIEETSQDHLTICHDWVLTPVDAAILGQTGVLCSPCNASVTNAYKKLG